MVNKYLNKVSGPLMDRIDLHIEVTPLSHSALAEKQLGEPSEAIRQRVIAARKIQEERYKDHKGIHCNAQMTTKLFRQYCEINEECQNLMKIAMDRLGLSARAYDRILKVARTIADLDNSEKITVDHLSEAINYRSLDRDSWGR
jgi:magnesium chelatase family protein